MRFVAKILLVLSVMSGLALPKLTVGAHEVPCDKSGDCSNVVLTTPGHGSACDPCPPLAECSCESENSGEEQDQHGGDCPVQHHHHHCVCGVAGTSLIAYSDSLLLQPHQPDESLVVRERSFLPESPVAPLYRPPIA